MKTSVEFTMMTLKWKQQLFYASKKRNEKSWMLIRMGKEILWNENRDE